MRIVILTSQGRDLIVTAFRKHAGQMKRVIYELSPEELRGFGAQERRQARYRAHGVKLNGFKCLIGLKALGQVRGDTS